MSSLDVTTSARIEAPLELVAAFTANPDNAPVWHGSVTGVDWLSERQVAVGARVVFHMSLLGRTLLFPTEITAFTSGETLTMDSTDGPFPMSNTYHWVRDGGDATIMSIRNLSQPTGFSRKATPLLARSVRRAIARDLANLVALTKAMTGEF